MPHLLFDTPPSELRLLTFMDTSGQYKGEIRTRDQQIVLVTEYGYPSSHAALKVLDTMVKWAHPS